MSRFRDFLEAIFPERQIYIRNEGRVQYFTFGPGMQAVLSGITLAFLGWVAFTSINVVFKDHIIAERQNRFLQERFSRVAIQDALLNSLDKSIGAGEALRQCAEKGCTKDLLADYDRTATALNQTYKSFALKDAPSFVRNQSVAENATLFRRFWRFAYLTTENFMTYVMVMATGKPPEAVSGEAVVGTLISLVALILTVTGAIFGIVLRLIRGTGKRRRRHS